MCNLEASVVINKDRKKGRGIRGIHVQSECLHRCLVNATGTDRGFVHRELATYLALARVKWPILKHQRV